MQMVIETTVDDGAPVAETLSFSYDASGIPMSVVYNGTAYFYTVNLQGDVMAIVDATGTAVVSYAYDAWGNILSVTGTMADTLGESNPLRYRGYVYDPETELYYLQSRYYDPELGRFINADAFTSTGQGILGNNMFAYCLNNPVNLTDPFGLFSLGVSRRFSNEVSNCLFGGMLGIAFVGGIITAGITYGPTLAEAFEETAEKIKAWVEAQATQEDPRDNSVYVLKDPNDGNLVKYVGRTNDTVRRGNEHKHDPVHPWRRHYVMIVVVTGLTKEQAISWEQSIISAYTLSYLENARREIAVKNVGKYQSYLCAVAELITGLPASDIYELIGGR